MRQTRMKTFWWVLYTTALLLSFSWTATASPPMVTANYLQQKANGGILQLAIASPAPASVIVSLNLPAGYDILSASPDFKKRSQKHREVKWLLKDVTPGNRAISFVLSAPFTFSQIPARELANVILVVT